MNALNGKVHRNALATQQIVLKYIDGQGKLDDIPLLIKDNE
jgi:hypothetical protein